jgi:small subunit ribosomal protein S6
MEARLYDLIFICRPGTPEEEVAKLTHTLEQVVTEHGGKVEKTENWGTRRLAYPVSRNREGIYVYLQITGTQSEMIKELERRLKVVEPVIKYQTIRLDEEIKRQKKLVALREKKLARRPRRTAPPAAEQTAAAS